MKSPNFIEFFKLINLCKSNFNLVLFGKVQETNPSYKFDNSMTMLQLLQGPKPRTVDPGPRSKKIPSKLEVAPHALGAKC